MTDSIKIDTPASIRGYHSGGKGGYGYQSTPLHRLVERTRTSDVTACRVSMGGMKIAVTEGAPKPALVAKYGACKTCWPELKEATSG